MSDNYPAGVSNSHPHFNQTEVTVEVQCGREEATVVPENAIAMGLDELLDLLSPTRWKSTPLGTLLTKVSVLRQQVTDLSRDGEYECPYEGEVEVEVREDAEWTCPLCGATHEIDSTPEGPDPDAAWDARHGN